MELQNNEDRPFGSFSDEFLARKVLGDSKSNDREKEVSFRLLSTIKQREFREVPNPPGHETVSTSGAGPHVCVGDKILSHDGTWFDAGTMQVGTAIDRWARVARDFR